MKLNSEEQHIHELALKNGINFTRAEWPLIQSLQSIERTKLYKKFDKRSTKTYATHFFGLSEAVAEMYCAVAKKAISVPELVEALGAGAITVGKASRFLSVVTSENAASLIEFARNHTDREIDFEVGRRDPRAVPKDKVKVLSGTHVLVITAMTNEDYEKLQRVRSLEAQKQNLATLGTLVGICAETHLEKHDPIRKAQRARPKKSSAKPGRKPTAAQIHVVNLRDQGRCTYVDENGVRCNSDRWVEKHHIHHFRSGGGNEPENLTTLCAHHHDLVHQFELPLDGHISWQKH